MTFFIVLASQCVVLFFAILAAIVDVRRSTD